MNEKKNETLLTASDVAKKFNVSSDLILDQARKGKLPSKKVSRFYLFENNVLNVIIQDYDNKMQFITEKNAAKKIGVSRGKLKSMAARGKCRKIVIGGSVRYLKSDIDALFANLDTNNKIEKHKQTVTINNKMDCNMSGKTSNLNKKENDSANTVEADELLRTLLQFSLCSAVTAIELLNNRRERLEEVISFLSDLENLSAKDKSYYNGTVNMDNLTFYKNTLIEIARTLKEHENLMNSIDTDFKTKIEEANKVNEQKEDKK